MLLSFSYERLKLVYRSQKSQTTLPWPCSGSGHGVKTAGVLYTGGRYLLSFSPHMLWMALVGSSTNFMGSGLVLPSPTAQVRSFPINWRTLPFGASTSPGSFCKWWCYVDDLQTELSGCVLVLVGFGQEWPSPTTVSSFWLVYALELQLREMVEARSPPEPGVYLLKIRLR